MTRTILAGTAAVALGVGILVCPASHAQGYGAEEGAQAGDQAMQAGQQMQTETVSLQELTRDWPEASKKAAQDMQQKYGAPSGVTPSRVVWQDKGPWKEIIVYKEEVQHDFPMPHTDVLEQVIAYDVPADKFDELAEYDGSVIAERTKGTLAARCDREEANFLALNLAEDIVKGEKSVEEARQAYAEAIQQFKGGQQPDIMQQLTFQPPQEAGDTDVAVIGEQAGQAQPAAGQEMPQQEQQQQMPQQQR